MAFWLSNADRENRKRDPFDVPSRIVAGVGLALYLFLRWLHNFDELTPTHDNIGVSCVVIAGLAGVAASIAVVWFSRDSMTETYVNAAAILLGGSLLAFLVLSQAASLLEGWIDFPPSRTTSSTAMLPISRAYVSNGKGGPYWYIETDPPIKMQVTESDYNLINTNPTPDGYCVELTVQTSGHAIRIMHARDRHLPSGSVKRCPQDLKPVL